MPQGEATLTRAPNLERRRRRDQSFHFLALFLTALLVGSLMTQVAPARLRSRDVPRPSGSALTALWVVAYVTDAFARPRARHGRRALRDPRRAEAAERPRRRRDRRRHLRRPRPALAVPARVHAKAHRPTSPPTTRGRSPTTSSSPSRSVAAERRLRAARGDRQARTARSCSPPPRSNEQGPDEDPRRRRGAEGDRRAPRQRRSSCPTRAASIGACPTRSTS